MVQVTVASTLGVPGTADSGSLTQDSLTVDGFTGNALTNRYTDLDGTNIDRAGLILSAQLTSQDIQYFLSSMVNGSAISTGGTTLLDSTGDVFNILWVSTGSAQFDDHSTLEGEWNFTNSRIIRRTTGGTRYIFGNYMAPAIGGNGPWRLIANNLDIISYGGNITFHTGNLDLDGSTLNGVRLIGNTTAELNTRSAAFGFAPANVASQGALDNSGVYNGVTYGYSFRFVHQGLPDANVAGTDGGDGSTPQEWALYTNANIVDVVGAGSDFGTGQTILQLNRRSAPWLLNPNMGNQVGEPNAGRDLLLGFHINNAPGTGNEASEIRTYIADRQTFQDAAGADVVGTKVAYSSDTRVLPAAYARATPPAAVANNEVTVDSSAHRGVMVLSQRNYYNNRAGSANAGARDPAGTGNQLAALRTDITRTVRNFRYDYTYQSNVVYSPDTMTALLTATATPNEGIDLNEFLNSRTASSDLVNGISDLADEYAAIRSFWYNSTTLPGTMPVTPAGTMLTYDRAVTYQTTGTVGFTGSTVTIVSNTTPDLTGTIVDRVYGSNAVNWNNIAFPNGIGISGGNHANLPNLSTTTDWRIIGDTVFTMQVAAGTYLFSEIFGGLTIDPSATLTVNSINNITIQATADQMARLAAGTAGAGTVTLELAPIFNTVTIDTTVGGYYALVVNGSEVTPPTLFAAGSTFTPIRLSTDDYSQGNFIDVYVKYNSDIASRTYYQEQRVRFLFNAMADTSHLVNLSPRVASTLVEDASTVLPSTLPQSGIDGAPDGNDVLVTLTATPNAALNIQPNDGQTIAGTIANEGEYFDAWYENRATTLEPILQYNQNQTMNWDQSRITFQSGNQTTGATQFRIQHVIRNWETRGTGTFANARTGAAEVQGQVAGAAALGTVIAAVDSSTVLGDVHNFAGNLATNPLLTQPQGGFDRTNRTYGTNIEE